MILIAPFFRRHGIGYLDIITWSLNKNFKRLDKVKNIKNNQYTVLNEIYKSTSLEYIDKVYFLYLKDLTNSVEQRCSEFLSMQKQKLIKKSFEKDQCFRKDFYTEYSMFMDEVKKNNKFPTYNWLKKNFKKNIKLLHHIINEFDMDTQIKWHEDHSFLFTKFKSKIKYIALELKKKDIEDPYKTTNTLKKWIDSLNINFSDLYINLWGTNTTFQMGWYYFCWSEPKFKDVTLLECKTVNKNTDSRFPDFMINVVEKDLISKLEKDRSNIILSKNQNTALMKVKSFVNLNDNFTILITGERGTGKTKIIEDVLRDKNIISSSCAFFSHDISSARSELFGHVKGSFTDAKTNKKGLFELANNGVLFLDEIHHLDISIQALLLKALQTDDSGNFKYTPLGETEEKSTKFQLIVASNLSMDKLQERLLDDFYDRISQRKIKIPSLIEKIDSDNFISKEFKKVWESMQFKDKNGKAVMYYVDSKFEQWLNKQKKFPGNYRDLQQIAILCADYIRIKNNSSFKFSEVFTEDSMHEYVKNNWNYKLKISKDEKSLLEILDENSVFTAEKIINQLKKQLAISLEAFEGDQRRAAAKLGITVKTLIEWKKLNAIS